MAEYALKSVHISCLYYLYSMGSMTSAQLCEYCEEDKAAISRSVEYLESNGYLVRQNQGKKYKSPLLLTDKGRCLGQSITTKISDLLDGLNNILSEQERVLFYRQLTQISEYLASAAEQEQKG